MLTIKSSLGLRTAMISSDVMTCCTGKKRNFSDETALNFIYYAATSVHVPVLPVIDNCVWKSKRPDQLNKTVWRSAIAHKAIKLIQGIEDLINREEHNHKTYHRENSGHEFEDPTSLDTREYQGLLPLVEIRLLGDGNKQCLFLFWL